MNSFFDVFKWDRFIAPSAMELLFWLFSAIAVLFGVWGLSAGIAMTAVDPVPGLILIAVSIIGALAGIVAARVACEAIVILFRVNENLMDIAERGLAIGASPIVDSESVRLDRRVAEARERASAARAEAVIERPAIDHRPSETQPAAAEARERDPFAPDHGRVEPKAWDVKPVEAKPVTDGKPVTEARLVTEARPVADAKPSVEAKTAAESRVVPEPKPVIEAEPVELRVREPAGVAKASEPRSPERRTPPPPTITLPDRSETRPAGEDRSSGEARTAGRDAARRPPGRTPEPLIEHALRRLSEPAGTAAMRASLAPQETRAQEARPNQVDFLGVARPEPPRAIPPAPAPDDDVTPLPAFIGARKAMAPAEAPASRAAPAAPIELPPILAKERSRKRNGHVATATPEPAPRVEPAPPPAASAPKAAPARQAAPASEAAPPPQPKAVPAPAGRNGPAGKSGPAGKNGPAGKGPGNTRPAKGGQAPLKRRRPRPRSDGG